MTLKEKLDEKIIQGSNPTYKLWQEIESIFLNASAKQLSEGMTIDISLYECHDDYSKVIIVFSTSGSNTGRLETIIGYKASTFSQVLEICTQNGIIVKRYHDYNFSLTYNPN